MPYKSKFTLAEAEAAAAGEVGAAAAGEVVAAACVPAADSRPREECHAAPAPQRVQHHVQVPAVVRGLVAVR